MISPEDEQWLEQVFSTCFSSENDTDSRHKRILQGFSMLVRTMVKNLAQQLDETQALWQQAPTSGELAEKFNLLSRNLLYLEKYCQEKIDRDLPHNTPT